MGIEKSGSDEEIIEKGIKAVEDFYRAIKMPTSIKELGYEPTEEQIKEMAEKCSLATKDNLGSVHVLHKADMEAIYRNAL